MKASVRTRLLGLAAAAAMVIGGASSASANTAPPEFSSISSADAVAEWSPEESTLRTLHADAVAAGQVTTHALCGQLDVWTNKDPRTCEGHYTVRQFGPDLPYQGKVIFQTYYGAPGYQRMWNAVASGYQATQDWCADNSATCAVVTSVGVSIVGGWIKAATG